MEYMIMQKVKLIFLTVFLFLPMFVNAQTCNSAIMAVAPDSRYQDRGDGTITDLETGLMWKKCSEGLTGSDCAAGSATTHTWQVALQISQTLNTGGGFAGYSDWRVPNTRELLSLVEEQCYSPAINLTLFPNTLSLYYWTSSPYSYLEDAWIVRYSDGLVSRDSRVNNYYVRLVRAGQ